MASFPSRNQTLTIAVKKHVKTRYQTFLVLSSFTGFLYFVPNILSRIVWANKVLVLTWPSLLQTVIFWHFVCYRSNSPIFKENMKQVSWMFRSKIDSRQFSLLLIGSFLTELTLLNQMSIFSRNLNHHWKCREQKESF